MIIDKPWGHEEIIKNNGRYVIKKLYINPKSKLSTQYHEKKIETMLLLEGECVLHTQSDSYNKLNYMKVDKFYFIPARLTHYLITAESSAVVLEISTPELDDVVRLKDDYGRI